MKASAKASSFLAFVRVCVHINLHSRSIHLYRLMSCAAAAPAPQHEATGCFKSLTSMLVCGQRTAARTSWRCGLAEHVARDPCSRAPCRRGRCTPTLSGGRNGATAAQLLKHSTPKTLGHLRAARSAEHVDPCPWPDSARRQPAGAGRARTARRRRRCSGWGQ